MKEKGRTDPAIRAILALTAFFIAADFAALLYFDYQAGRVKKAELNEPGHQNSGNAAFFDGLDMSGARSKHTASYGRVDFSFSKEPVLKPGGKIYALTACCPGGVRREYYTLKLPWEFHLYVFEAGLDTLTLFEKDSGGTSGRFEIVVLNPAADESSIQAVSVSAFTGILSEYMPGIKWSGSVRKERM
ncbi:MAG TPA: hypothetical protein P5511_03075, partial [Candidatus Goldiibacteriota bacterium]|mgnify:CR=1|nr:hypothetical protein [Candidatus Goldiibacteriota bacterium]